MTSVFSTKFYQVHKVDEFIQEGWNIIESTNWTDPSMKDEINKILVDGSSQEGENISPTSGRAYYKVQ